MHQLNIAALYRPFVKIQEARTNLHSSYKFKIRISFCSNTQETQERIYNQGKIRVKIRVYFYAAKEGAFIGHLVRMQGQNGCAIYKSEMSKSHKLDFFTLTFFTQKFFY